MPNFAHNIEQMTGKRPSIFFVVCWRFIVPGLLTVRVFVRSHIWIIKLFNGNLEAAIWIVIFINTGGVKQRKAPQSVKTLYKNLISSVICMTYNVMKELGWDILKKRPYARQNIC